MIEGACKLCGNTSGMEMLDISACSDTYLDHIGIDYTLYKRRYFRCDDCGLAYRDPILTKKEKDLLYTHFRDATLRNETGEQYFRRIAELPPEQSENDEKCNYLKNFIGDRGSLLDVGAGYGVFIHCFQRQFTAWTVLGVEPTNGVSEIGKKNGVRIIEAYLDNHSQESIGTSFDLITVNHVLEHVDNPTEFLRRVASHLSSMGMLYVEVPSIEDIGFLPKEHDRFMCQHEVIYDSQTLIKLIESVGLNLIDSSNFMSKRGRNNLRIMCKKARND